MSNNPSTPSIAIIGGGTSGISAARALAEHNLSYKLFESRPTLGGIWSEHQSPIFNNLITNTSVFETCFSDFPPIRTQPAEFLHPDDTFYITNKELYHYLDSAAAATPGLSDNVSLDTTVTNISRNDNGQYLVQSIKAAQQPMQELFDKVIIASGFFNNRMIPPICGLETTNIETLHVSDYHTPQQFKGKRVMVVGGSISGCEAAADLSHEVGTENGPKSVVLNTRTMRAVIAKQKDGRPLMPMISTRWQQLRSLADRFGEKEYCEDMQELVEITSRNEHYKIPPPDGPLKRDMYPGWTIGSWKLLKAASEGRVRWRIAGIEKIEDNAVRFVDGAYEEVDVIVLATGYELKLPFLEDQMLTKVLKKGERSLMDLYDYTFHPELNGMAFLGLFPPGSATIPCVDLQARWIGGVYADKTKLPSENVMWEGINKYKKERSRPESHFVVFGREVMDTFAKHIGCEVDFASAPELTKGLLFGPVVPAQFRMFGQGRREDAKDWCEKQLRAGGYTPGDNHVERDVLEELIRVAKILEDKNKSPKGFKKAVDYLVMLNS